MRALLLAVLVIASPAFAAVTPPGGGTTPTPVVPPSGIRTLTVRGRLPGQPDGAVSMRFKLFVPSTSQWLDNSVPVLEETQSVTVENGWFTAFVGHGTTGGIDSTLLTGHASLYCSWALASAPETSLGGLRIASAAFAMRLVPGAQAEGHSATPTLELTNTSGSGVSAMVTGTTKAAAAFTAGGSGAGAGVRAETGSGSGRGARGLATSTWGSATGVEGRAASPNGAGGVFINTGGWDLLRAANGVNATPSFRVTEYGDVLSQGSVVQQYGPRGAMGPQGVPGTKGVDGPTGMRGPAGPKGQSGGSVLSFSVARVGNSCAGACSGLFSVKDSAVSPCEVQSDTGYLSWLGTDGVCCLCGK